MNREPNPKGWLKHNRVIVTYKHASNWLLYFCVATWTITIISSICFSFLFFFFFFCFLFLLFMPSVRALKFTDLGLVKLHARFTHLGSLGVCSLVQSIPLFEIFLLFCLLPKLSKRAGLQGPRKKEN